MRMAGRVGRRAQQRYWLTAQSGANAKIGAGREKSVPPVASMQLWIYRRIVRRGPEWSTSKRPCDRPGFSAWMPASGRKLGKHIEKTCKDGHWGPGSCSQCVIVGWFCAQASRETLAA
jgi:hypothetical protein